MLALEFPFIVIAFDIEGESDLENKLFGKILFIWETETAPIT